MVLLEMPSLPYRTELPILLSMQVGMYIAVSLSSFCLRLLMYGRTCMPGSQRAAFCLIEIRMMTHMMDTGLNL